MVVLMKGKAKPVGSVSPNGKYKKNAKGEWVPNTKGTAPGKGENTSRKITHSIAYVPADKFDAHKWASQWDTPDITSKQILDSIKSDEIKQKILETEEKLKKVVTTDTKYRVSGKNASAVYTPQRTQIHGEIIGSILSEKAIENATPVNGRKPVFIMLGGRGGSGKSHLKGEAYDPEKCIVLDADEVKGKLAEYQGWNAWEVHAESSDIIEKMTVIAKELGLNLVVDATMRQTNYVVDVAKNFKENGYSVECHYMHLPRADASKRAVSRFAEAGRYVPVDAILNNTTNEASFDAVKAFADAWSFTDNQGAPPPDLVSKQGQGRFSKLAKSMLVFGGRK